MNRNLQRFRILLSLLGTCFLSIAHASTYSVLSGFNSTDGTHRYGQLVQGTDGNFYGTTEDGGSTGFGTVFKSNSAGVVTTLVNFVTTNGANPRAGLIRGAGTDTYFYGTTSGGGSSGLGTIFKVSSTGVLTTLATFDGTNGANPYASLIEDNNGNFYGTTSSGGSSNLGTIFKLSSGGVLTTLVNFNGTNGANPYARLIQGLDGNFYGTTYNGGSSNMGTIFKVTPAGVLSTMATFNGANGSQPYAGVVQDKYGTFYGTTIKGGSGGNGTFFSLNYARALTTLVNFNYNNGASPCADIVQGTDGDFYGTTELGGTSGQGTLFKVNSSGGLTTLVNCTFASGTFPFGGMVQAKDGTFYGTTSGTASGYGSVYRLNPTSIAPYLLGSAGAIGETNRGFMIKGSTINLNLGVPLSVGNVLTVIHNTGGTPISGTFTNLPDGGTITGTYYSATYNFTASYSGNGGDDLTLTVKSVSGFTVIHDFAGRSNPGAGLVQGRDGNFYGTTEEGGTSGNGAVFKLTSAGAVSNLVAFNGTNGSTSLAGLVQGSDGFYGTTSLGGGSGDGTVFKVTPAGALTTLVNFNGANGSQPYAGLVRSTTDGDFYGTTFLGGSSSDGTVFKVTSAGVLTTLVNFSGANGKAPVASLVQGSDGNFYGTTQQGGSDNQGTLFKVTAAGVLTTLVNFNYYTIGANPTGGLVQGTDGNFYGTTMSGGTFGDGTVFRVTPGGVLTTLVNFDYAITGANPTASLLQATDGNFYGTTAGGGGTGYGTVFKVTPAGAFTSLFSFTGTDCANPNGALVQGTDGSFYGTTTFGGTETGEGFGGIFRF